MNGIDLYNFQYLAYADYLGTFTFAISGALVAQKRSFDIFGDRAYLFISHHIGGSQCRYQQYILARSNEK